MEPQPTSPDQPAAEPNPAVQPLITPTVITPTTGTSMPTEPAAPSVMPPAQSPMTPETPAVQNGASVSSPMAPPPSGGTRRLPNVSKKKLLTFGTPAFVVILLLGGVFGYYLPNRPQTVWKTGLDRSGKALDKLIEKATEQKSLDSMKKSNIILAMDATVGKSSYSGSLNSKFDATKSDNALEIKLKQDGSGDKTITGKILSEIPAGSAFPTIYFQVTGLKSLGYDEFIPSLTAYEGKWITLDESYFKSLGVTDAQIKELKDGQVSSADIATTVRSLTDVTSDYVLTSKPDKAIFDQKSYVGKEKVDGVSAFHYTVGLNKQHLKDFCKAFIEAGVQTPVYKKFNQHGTDEQKNNAIKDCQEEIEQDKDMATQTFDLWVDAKYKLLHKVRITEKGSKNYVDVGQTYKGGDEITLFANYHYDNNEKGDVNSSVTTNLKTLKTTGKVTAKGGIGDESYTVNVTLTAEPYKGDINVTKPDGAIPIQQLLQSFGLDGGGSSSSFSIGTKAQDTERQTDIKALHGQIEAFYAAKGYYPNLKDMNSATWRATNMKGLDQEALKDPAGSGFTLAAAPTKNSYSYAVKTSAGKSCESNESSCATYTLTTYLADGSTYQKQSLN